MKPSPRPPSAPFNLFSFSWLSARARFAEPFVACAVGSRENENPGARHCTCVCVCTVEKSKFYTAISSGSQQRPPAPVPCLSGGHSGETASPRPHALPVLDAVQMATPSIPHMPEPRFIGFVRFSTVRSLANCIAN